MKTTWNAMLRGLLTLALLSVAAASALAEVQSRDARFISAKAGGVNFVTGKVEFRRAGEKVWLRLTTNDDLKSGDVVKTGVDGRAEVLLNPGSYLRLGENTEFELVDMSLDDLRLGLKSGSAVVEATGYSNLDLSIAVETPQTLARIVRSGIYRFDAEPGANVTEVTVEKGRAYVGRPEVLYKGGKVVRVGAGGQTEVAKFDKKERDALDLWSRERGKELTKINEQLSRRNANALLARANLDMFPSRFASTGVWYYNARSGCYTFLPFGGYGYWRSPYGGWYGNQLHMPYTNAYGRCVNCNGGIVTNNGGGATVAPNGGNSGGQPVVGGSPSQPTMVIPRNQEPSRQLPSIDRGGDNAPMRHRTVEPGHNR